MDIALKKVELIEWLVRIQDESLLQSVEALRKKAVADAYQRNTPRTLEELQESLDRSQLDILAGRVYTQDQVEGIIRSKYGK
jgi:hypothetical protein